MILTPEQTTILERAKALVDANPDDHTSTMELVRGLVGIVGVQDRVTAVALGTQRAVIKTAKDVIETLIDEWPNEWARNPNGFYSDCMEAFKACDAALD